MLESAAAGLVILALAASVTGRGADGGRNGTVESFAEVGRTTDGPASPALVTKGRTDNRSQRRVSLAGDRSPSSPATSRTDDQTPTPRHRRAAARVDPRQRDPAVIWRPRDGHANRFVCRRPASGHKESEQDRLWKEDPSHGTPDEPDPSTCSLRRINKLVQAVDRTLSGVTSCPDRHPNDRDPRSSVSH